MPTTPATTSPTARRPVHTSASATALTILVELVAPIALFYGLRSAGAGIYLAVILGGVGPALSATVKAIRYRRVDSLAVAVLITLVVSAGVSLIGGGPQFLLAKDSLLTAAWGTWFFVSLRAERPLTFRFSRPLLEGCKIFDPRTRRWVASTGSSWDELWERVPRFGRVWRVTTVMWGAAMVVDAILRVAMAYMLPADLVPGLGGALWLVTFVALQVITNIYFIRSGLWTILLGELPDDARPDHGQADRLALLRTQSGLPASAPSLLRQRTPAEPIVTAAKGSVNESADLASSTRHAGDAENSVTVASPQRRTGEDFGP